VSERSGQVRQGDEAAPAARRGWWPKRRRTVWQDHRGRPLVELLDGLGPDVERLYLVGDRPGGGTVDGMRAWGRAELPPGWSEGEHHEHHARPSWTYVRPSGDTVKVLRAATWFGDGQYDAQQAAGAAELLRVELARAFHSRRDGGQDRGLLDTPATTGRALILAAFPFDLELPQTPDDVRDLVRATSTQGRWQTFGPPVGDTPTLLTEPATLPAGVDAYDLRWAYAALCSELPGEYRGHVDGLGVAGVDHEAFSAGGSWRYTRCRVRVVGRVGLVDGSWPFGIGLVPQLGADHVADACDACGRAPSSGASAVCWPSVAGAPFDAWVDGAEAALLADVGQPFRVREALVWDRARSLDGWAEKLQTVRGRLADRWKVDTANRPAVKLAADAARMVLLQGIGAVHGTASSVVRTVDSVDQVPDGADVYLTPGGELEYRQQQRSAWSALDRPEWSSAVWGRCRARIAWHRPQNSGALTVDPSALVAIRQDALYLVGGTSVDHWQPDDGRVGWLRPVEGVPGPVPWPRSGAELLTLRGA